MVRCSGQDSRLRKCQGVCVFTDEMKKVFGTDKRRIEHTLTVLDYAERIRTVEGGDALVEQRLKRRLIRYLGPAQVRKWQKSCLLCVIGNNQPQTQFNREVVRYEYVLLPV